jgi:anion-transporting  ArsA/GET3 family ATPase
VNLLDRQLIFVTGKGGVGKTTVAAALAQLAAQHGKRTLVCEMDAKGSLAAAFDCSPFPYNAREVDTDLFAMAMNTEDSLREYLRLFVRIPFVGRIGPLARTFDFVADAAPGVKEILAVGKLCYEVRERHYDLVVVDAEASGHIVAQIAAPNAIRELVQVGLVRDQTDWMIEVLSDPVRTGLVVVTTPEEMPVTETIELVARLRAEVEVPLGVVIVNRVLPELFTHADEETFEALRAPDAIEVLQAHAGRGAVEVLDAARLAVSLRRTRAAHLDELRETVNLPLLYVPYLFVRDHGLRVTRMVADALGAELGH